MTVNETTQKLVAALREAGASKAMILRAEAAQYDDYLSDSATPITDLYVAARAEGLTQIVERAVNGDFDATEEESNAWAASEDGQATFRELMGPPTHRPWRAGT